ncbi:YjbF family lipoprotein [Psychromonas sp.]|uniref:YjbF family lipoprotein n=1 Tax=Psychromonas sp. TaxID=1884585 RepID=UPI003A97DA1F
MFPPSLNFYFIVFFIVFLSGCSQKFQGATDSVKAAIEFNKGATITPEYIASIPYANTLVTINDDKQILLVLAYIGINPTNNAVQLTWISNDRGAIVTENGRIIHTTGFYNNNLEKLDAKDAHPPLPTDTTNWHAVYDWSPGYRYNFSAHVSADSLGTENLHTDLWTQPAEHIQELIDFRSLNSQFMNHYWVVPATTSTKAYVIKSIQYLGPQMDKVEMLMMRPYIEQKPNAQHAKDSES